jgi:hypothetical protein
MFIIMFMLVIIVILKIHVIMDINYRMNVGCCCLLSYLFIIQGFIFTISE